MTLILTQGVDLFDGLSSVTSGARGMIELHNDRFVLRRLSALTGESKTVIDSPLGDLTVVGSMATLTFTAGDVTQKVDFSNGSSDALMKTDNLLFRTRRILRESGIYAWLKELRVRSVSVKYRSLNQVLLWGALGTAVILVFIAVYVVNQM